MMILGRIALVALVLSTASQAFALPAYAKKEKKDCKFCHVNASGGGKRNAAGEWYKTHNHSLKGFKEPGKAAPKKK